jgi:hypothetical protein
MEPQDVIMSWKKMEPGAREGLLVAGALLVVIFLSLVWAVFIRKPSRRKHHRHHRHSHSGSPAPAQATAGGDPTPATGSSRRRRWRRRRREHRPRNPTLSETGGLPPFRSEGPPPP